MIFKKHIILIALIFATLGISAQSNNNEKFVISVSGAYHKSFSSGLALMYIPDYECCMGGYGMWGIFAGSDIVFDKDKPIFAPKIGGQIAGMLFCLRLSEINYIHSQGTDIRLLPEIGFDFLGYFNVCYGYNVHIAGKKYDEMSSHRVTLTANLFFDMSKKKKKK